MRREEFENTYSATAFSFGDEAQAACEALVAEVWAKLPMRDSDTRADLANVVLLSLWHDYGVHVTGIGVDQWLGITAEHYDAKLHLYVQCDHIVYGLASVWLACAHRLVSSYSIERDSRDG